MTTFSRYYDEEGILHETTMDQLENLLKDEKNKAQIAKLIYHRYYERYLKIFDYADSIKKTYCDDKRNVRGEFSVFNMEYKNGFAIMANCCLLIETLASFLNGFDKTPDRSAVKAYKKVFEKAKNDYDNNLGVFLNEPIYGAVRCGLLHQGETYEGFKIRRDGQILFDKKAKIINATLFLNSSKEFLKSFQDELSNKAWDDDLWDRCRIKLRYIIENTRKL